MHNNTTMFDQLIISLVNDIDYCSDSEKFLVNSIGTTLILHQLDHLGLNNYSREEILGNEGLYFQVYEMFNNYKFSNYASNSDSR